jgi:hypothetical protein
LQSGNLLRQWLLKSFQGVSNSRKAWLSIRG